MAWNVTEGDSSNSARMRATVPVRMYWRARDRRIGKLHAFATSVRHSPIAIRFLRNLLPFRIQDRLALIVKPQPLKWSELHPAIATEPEIDAGFIRGGCGIEFLSHDRISCFYSHTTVNKCFAREYAT